MQAVLRHRWLSSTEVYTRARIEDVITRVQQHYARPAPAPSAQEPVWRYAAEDWRELFGQEAD